MTTFTEAITYIIKLEMEYAMEMGDSEWHDALEAWLKQMPEEPSDEDDV